MVLAGDPNLQGYDAQQCCQTETSDPTVAGSWRVVSSAYAKGGDVCFVKGATAEMFEIPIGFSYFDRGMRIDEHDAFGITIVVPLTRPKRPAPSSTDSLPPTPSSHSPPPTPSLSSSPFYGRRFVSRTPSFVPD